jgi:hypothetical protein
MSTAVARYVRPIPLPMASADFSERESSHR